MARSALVRCLVRCMLVVATGAPLSLAQPTDLDALMARVLENRDENWRHLQGFLLSERERFSLTGPDLTRLVGMDREFIWVARDGVAVRTLVRANGVKARGTASTDARAHEEATLGKFMRFPFDPGNYYLVGRETIDDVEVLRIEYLPTRLFQPDEKDSSPPSAIEERIDFAFNKVSQVTLWVDPAREQIVRATFDNVDFSFLPGRSLVRMEEAQAIMEMGQPIPGVWLPTRTSVTGTATLAIGTFTADYTREYFDYRQSDVRVRFTIHEPDR